MKQTVFCKIADLWMPIICTPDAMMPAEE